MSFGLGLLKREKPETSSSEPVEAPPNPTPKAQKRRKPNERLASVVNETTTGSAIDRLRQNKPFAVPNDRGWVVLLLSADAIGGLSQKQQGDEAKGSIIQLISSDQIEIVATEKMLAEEFLAVIPTSSTLSRMEEYSLLVDAPYHWAVARSVDDGAQLELEVVSEEATFTEAVSVAAGSRKLSDLFAPPVWGWLSGTDDVSTEPARDSAADSGMINGVAEQAPENEMETTQGLDDANIEGPGVDSSIEVMEPAVSGSEITEDHQSDESERDDEEAASPQAVAASGEVDGDLDLGLEEESDEEEHVDEEIDSEFAFVEDEPAVSQEDAYRQYVVANESRVVTEEEVRETIARRFLTEDLDMQVDLESFERTFATQAPEVTITEAADPSDWLGSQVAQLTRQANAELEQLHGSNVSELRELYVETMSLHAEGILREVSTERAGSRYKSLMDGAERDFDALKRDTPAQVAQRVAQIVDRFEKEADDRAQQAAAHARVQFKNNNKHRVERETSEVGLEIDRRNEEIFAHARQTILEMRRKDAATRMDMGMTRTMQLLMEREEEQRSSEASLLQRWNNELTRFIDDNRKNHVARAEALAEDLARENQVEINKAEHATRLDEMRRDHADRIRRLEAEMMAHREEALAELNKHDERARHSLSLEQERTRSANYLASTLSDQMAQLKGTLDEQYQDRITELEADKRSQVAALEWSNHIQVRANRIMIVLAVLLALVTLAVGTIIGWTWGR